MPSYNTGVPVPLTTSTTVSPAAGTEVIFTVPANTVWVPQAFTCVFTASAAVANRFPTFAIDDGVNTLFVNGPISTATAITASQIALLSGGVGMPALVTIGTGNVNWQIGFPQMIMQPGWRFKTATAALQAGDAYSACRLSVIQYT